MNEAAAVTETVAQWLSALRHSRLPVEIRQKAVDVMLDTVGCMVACSMLPEVRTIVDFVEEQGARQDCSIVGHRAKSSVVNAAMVNGGMARGGEVDVPFT